MKFLKSSSVLVFGLFLGGLCSPAAQANTNDASFDGTLDGATLSLDATNTNSTAALTSVPADSTAVADLPDDPGTTQQQATPAAGTPPPASAKPATTPDDLAQGRQTKRILFVVPNFRAVSADQQLPPQTVKEKFKTAMLDSLDYSSFIFVGAQAGIAQATSSYPEFGQGAKGYGRYYWHTLADAINENTWVEFIVPSILHEDTRYYTLGKGRFGKRVGYAVSRVFITRSDDGNRTFNFSEVIGAGAFSGIANLYYPSTERTLTKTYQRWVTNLAIDSGVFLFKEVWPDINNAVFHQKD
jgi:hypothetical protein